MVYLKRTDLIVLIWLLLSLVTVLFIPAALDVALSFTFLILIYERQFLTSFIIPYLLMIILNILINIIWLVVYTKQYTSFGDFVSIFWLIFYYLLLVNKLFVFGSFINLKYNPNEF